MLHNRKLLTSLLLVTSIWLSANASSACPFCTAVGPPFSQRRAAADWVLLAEVIDVDQAKRSAAPAMVSLRVQRIEKRPGQTRPQQTQLDPSEPTLPLVDLSTSVRAGSLLLLTGVLPPDQPQGQPTTGDLMSCQWESLLVDEASYGYFARLPAARAATTERLRYAARYLEHANAAVADDAYREFALAPFDQVAQIAPELPAKKLQAWLKDAAVPQDRKGLYGLMLGLVPNDSGKDFLEELVLAPADDFRAGYDGILGGYLLAAGEPGLQLLEKLLLANRTAAVGDVRHALTALRFYHQFGTTRDSLAISKQRLAEAMEQLLDQPDVAAAAVIDLARWQHWQALPRIVSHYPASTAELSKDLTDQQARDLRRAVVGYLLECPLPAARAALEKLRTADARTVTALEARHAEETAGAAARAQ